MKKTTISLIASAFLVTVSVNAAPKSTNDIVIEMAKKDKIEQMVAKENMIYDLVGKVIFEKGGVLSQSDVTSDVISHSIFAVDYPTILKNYKNEDITLVFTNRLESNGYKTYTALAIEDVIGASPSAIEGKLYTNSPNKNILASVTTNTQTVIPLKTEYIQIQYAAQSILSNTNNVISETAPLDTAKTWYYPDGNGGFIVRKYDAASSTWKDISTYSAIGGSGSGNDFIIFTEGTFDAKTTPGYPGAKALVQNGDLLDEYYWVDATTGWLKKSGGAGGGLFNGDVELALLANSYLSKSGGSIATADASAYGLGILSLTKKDNSATGGYWTDWTSGSSAGKVVVAKNIAGLSTKTWDNDTWGFVSNGSSGIWRMKKISGAWVYKPLTISDMVANYETKETGTYCEINNGEGTTYGTRTGDYWTINGVVNGAMSWVAKASNGAGAVVGYATKGDRSNLAATSSPSGIPFFAKTGDCSATTCNGSGGSYAGSVISSMYPFYYATAGNRLNNLIDAVPYANIAAAYAATSKAAGLLTNGTVIIWGVDNNGQPAWKRSTDNYIAPQAVDGLYLVGLPSGITATSATFTASGGDRYLNVSSISTFLSYASQNDSPDSSVTSKNAYKSTFGSSAAGYKVYLNGDGISGKALTNCGIYSGSVPYWSDNCSTVASQTVAITTGARANMPAPLSSTRVNITKNVDTPNYTSTGVSYASNTAYKQWFYSTSGTVVNQMVDAVLVTPNIYTNITANSVGVAYYNGIVFKKNGNYWQKNSVNVQGDGNTCAFTIGSLGSGKDGRCYYAADTACKYQVTVYSYNDSCSAGHHYNINTPYDFNAPNDFLDSCINQYYTLIIDSHSADSSCNIAFNLAKYGAYFLSPPSITLTPGASQTINSTYYFNIKNTSNFCPNGGVYDNAGSCFLY